MKKLKNVLKIIGIIFALILGIFVIYVDDYYHESDLAITYLQSNEKIDVYQGEGGYIFKPKEEIKAGFIFYPGGKVDYRAYSPFMHMLAENGIYSVISHMTCNLAFLSINQADLVKNNHKDIDFYIGGHSLGGVGATSYLKNNVDKFKGLVLMGSYSIYDFSSSNLKILSLLGENDEVMNASQYEKNKSNISGAKEVVIEGGIHSYFGSYGLQDGDGTPKISNIEQQKIIVNEITNFILD